MLNSRRGFIGSLGMGIVGATGLLLPAAVNGHWCRRGRVSSCPVNYYPAPDLLPAATPEAPRIQGVQIGVRPLSLIVVDKTLFLSSPYPYLAPYGNPTDPPPTTPIYGPGGNFYTWGYLTTGNVSTSPPNPTLLFLDSSGTPIGDRPVPKAPDPSWGAPAFLFLCHVPTTNTDPFYAMFTYKDASGVQHFPSYLTAGPFLTAG
jgi:hypothetical protein